MICFEAAKASEALAYSSIKYNRVRFIAFGVE